MLQIYIIFTKVVSKCTLQIKEGLSQLEIANVWT